MNKKAGKTNQEQKAGALFALAAFSFWGLVPVYFKAVAHVAPFEILLHRILWSVPFTACLIAFAKDWGNLKKAFVDREVLRTLLFTAVLVASNWFVFIYAITTNRVLDASLGYFINPLVNVVLGMVFLRERLRRAQIAAVVLAFTGTLILTVSHGRLPWISLYLAFSFGSYGLLRKKVRIESVNGLFVETSLVAPVALVFLFFRWQGGEMAFGTVDWQTTVLLLSAGAVTSLPLVWFTSGARKLRYSTVGVMQYVAPSLQFLLAVFCYHEPFTLQRLLTFSFIWAGLALFVWDSMKAGRGSG